MSFFELEPEVGGDFGPRTTGSLHVRPPRLTRFNYEFNVWLGDPLVEAVSNFIVTDPVKNRLIEAHASGVAFGEVEITKSARFHETYPAGLSLPHFSWLKINGHAGKDDFGLSAKGILVVSERVLRLLQDCGMKYCDIAEYHTGTE